MAEGQNWLVLVYKIPPEPSRYRVAVWRRLKGAGAIYLQNSVCILPDGPESRSLFLALSQEISESGGESLIFEARVLSPGEQDKIIEKFNSERDEEYSEFLEQCAAFLEEIKKETERENFTFGELEENEEGLGRLIVWLSKIRERDFFKAPKGYEAEARLEECRKALESFALRVYTASETI
ncbi:PaaX-like protein C-terminal domain-containing protein [Thermanaeromonas toyohensis ToBE]|uniref:PaaX-like protein C-terminal domain-containing protein n=1 Tax=Thermanaeromonas toyohensis ToBE TaxID=698762 RepID=A0A1W1W128_9FIRM|nr:Chromate resistance protein ChrB [Thermanaeromonas toyohensis]SMB99327.1 PaaX-like protein C-terminal domain-containing protein [Thermanaeromonas toyohensis ToBE]